MRAGRRMQQHVNSSRTRVSHLSGWHWRGVGVQSGRNNYSTDFVSSAAKRLSSSPSLSPTSCHHLKQLSLFKHPNSQFSALRVAAESTAKRIKYKWSSRLITIITILSEVAAQMPEAEDTRSCSSPSSTRSVWQLTGGQGRH